MERALDTAGVIPQEHMLRKLIFCEDESILYFSACQALVDTGIFHNASVYLRSEESLQVEWHCIREIKSCSSSFQPHEWLERLFSDRHQHSAKEPILWDPVADDPEMDNMALAIWPIHIQDVLIGALIGETEHEALNNRFYGSMLSLGQYVGLGMENVQIRQRTQRMAQLKQLEALPFQSNEAILITDAHANIIRVNHAFSKITGYEEFEVVGRNPRVLQSGRQSLQFYQEMWATIISEGVWSGQIWNRRKDGSVYSEWLTICSLKNALGEITNFLAHFVDLSNWASTETVMLKHLAYHDPLTSAFNRTYLRDRFQQWQEVGYEQARTLVFFLVDLDRFKQINDTYGHDAGDWVLKQAVEILRREIRLNDEIIRLGGDEFLLTMEGDWQPKDVKRLANRIMKKLTQPIIYQNNELQVGVSIGIAMQTGTHFSPDQLLKLADEAMYHIKRLGGGIQLNERPIPPLV